MPTPTYQELADQALEAIYAIQGGAQSYSISGPGGAQRIVTKANLSEIIKSHAHWQALATAEARGSRTTVTRIRKPSAPTT